MDSVLIVGDIDEKLVKALKKFNYDVYIDNTHNTIVENVEKHLIDLIVIGRTNRGHGVRLCKSLKEESATKRLPIVLLTEKQGDIQEINDLGLDRVEAFLTDVSLGKFLSSVATLLRMRKMVAKESEGKATLSEMNAHLRELTEKFKKELEDAREIQENLMPKELPRGDSYEVAAACVQLDEVGGDWYFVESKPSGKISLLIADVTGHGLPAAFIGCMTKLAMVAAGKEAPAELLYEMNNLMAPQMPQGRFVTIAACLYDPSTGRLDAARGGHPPVFVFHRQKDEIQELMEGGLAVGFMEEAPYGSEHTFLDVGDVALMVTDGFTEGQNREMEMYDNKNIHAALRLSTPEMSAKDTLNLLIDHFMEFTKGRVLKDDVTAIVLKRTA